MNSASLSLESQELITWMKAQDLTPAKLSRLTGFSYNHCWLLFRGKAIGLKTLARLLIVFGEEGPALRIAQAMRASEKKLS